MVFRLLLLILWPTITARGCECLTIGEACKLASLIIHSVDVAHKISERVKLDMQTTFSKIKDLINIGEANREIELS